MSLETLVFDHKASHDSTLLQFGLSSFSVFMFTSLPTVHSVLSASPMLEFNKHLPAHPHALLTLMSSMVFKRIESKLVLHSISLWTNLAWPHMPNLNHCIYTMHSPGGGLLLAQSYTLLGPTELAGTRQIQQECLAGSDTEIAWRIRVPEGRRRVQAAMALARLFWEHFVHSWHVLSEEKYSGRLQTLPWKGGSWETPDSQTCKGQRTCSPQR